LHRGRHHAVEQTAVASELAGQDGDAAGQPRSLPESPASLDQVLRRAAEAKGPEAEPHD
jgi:hypothetical protein